MVYCTRHDLSRFSAAKTMHCMHNATDIELHIAVGVHVADIAAHERLPHNVLHSSSNCLSINTHYNQGCIDTSMLQFNASLKGE